MRLTIKLNIIIIVLLFLRLGQEGTFDGASADYYCLFVFRLVYDKCFLLTNIEHLNSATFQTYYWCLNNWFSAA